MIAPALLLLAAAPAHAQGGHCSPYWAQVPPTPGSTIIPRSVVSFDDGSGPAIYATIEAQDGYVDTVRRYKNGVWTDLSATLPLNPWGPALVRWMWVRMLDLGSGLRPVVLGYFQHPNGLGFDQMAWGRVWDGTAWQDVPPGFVPADTSTWPAISGNIGNGLETFGIMASVQVVTFDGVVRWNGTSWTPMGVPVGYPAVIIHDFGSGPHLYILGGGPGSSGHDFWMWNGVTWERPSTNDFRISLRSAGHGGVPLNVGDCAKVFTDSTGTAIYVSGQIRLTSDTQHDIPGLGRFDGQTWTNVGGPNLPPDTIYARGPLEVFDDGTGTGPALYVTGAFSDYGGVPANGIVRYQNGQFSGVGWGVLPAGGIYQLVPGRDSRGPSLFITGGFSHVGGPNIVATNMVQLVGCPNCYADCDQSGHLDVSDFTCFIQKFLGPDPYANCDMNMTPPTLNVADFTCFMRRFAGGCN